MASMSAGQTAAFKSANSGAMVITPIHVETLVTGILASLVLIWFGWVCLSAYRTLREPRTRVTDAGGHVLRALFVTIVILALITFF